MAERLTSTQAQRVSGQRLSATSLTFLRRHTGGGQRDLLLHGVEGEAEVADEVGGHHAAAAVGLGGEVGGEPVDRGRGAPP